MIAGLHSYETPLPSRDPAPAAGPRALDPVPRQMPSPPPTGLSLPDRAPPIELMIPPAPPRPITRYERVKHAVDFGIALVLLVAFAPVIAIAAVVVRLTSSGPAFYSQVRVGEGGRQFRILKLRTMFHNCETISGARWSTPGDPRITPVGAFLRKTHIDELPQLVNVLKGEMSLVGPRPERPEIIPILEEAIPRYRERLQVRPGVTGLAQLRLPADSSIDSVRMKLAHDLLYIQSIGPWLDLRLMACTAFKMLKLPVAGILRLTRIPAVTVRAPAASSITAEPA
jgi:lipopolysaccharide/colanic/teichoic acid biosynthesis glycosyltransferase